MLKAQPCSHCRSRCQADARAHHFWCKLAMYHRADVNTRSSKIDGVSEKSLLYLDLRLLLAYAGVVNDAGVCKHPLKWWNKEAKGRIA